MMRILGIDPGIATIGFGMVESANNKFSLISCGVITTPAHTSLSSRLEQIYDDMLELLDTFKPDAVSVEELFSTPISLPVFPLRTAGSDTPCMPQGRGQGIRIHAASGQAVRGRLRQSGKNTGDGHGAENMQSPGSAETGRRRRRGRARDMSWKKHHFITVQRR